MTGGRLFILALSMAMLLPASVMAQTNGTRATAGAFQSLSAGEQKVGEALFQAQQATADGAAPLSLDQIAALKAERQSWVKVFEQMRALGLIRARTLGEAIARYEQHSRRSGEAAGSARTVVVSTGSGRIHTLAVSASPQSRLE